MYVTDAEEEVTFGVQSKALNKRQAVPLGKKLDGLRSDWWIITIHVNSDDPVCYVIRKDEVIERASRDKEGGAFWLEPRDYDQSEFRNAWDRIAVGKKIPFNGRQRAVRPAVASATVDDVSGVVKATVPIGYLDQQNGVKRPGPGKCLDVWEYLDRYGNVSAKDVRLVAKKMRWNQNNTLIELYRWRRFNGLSRLPPQ